jgi:sec-independent protein translocase protein TatB
VFNIGPMEFVVLAIVGLVVLGPDRLPSLAKDAARLIRSLREMATGARTQLRDELGPEFADLDLRNLNPRTALQKALFADEDETPAADQPAAPPAARPTPPPGERTGPAPFDADAT